MLDIVSFRIGLGDLFWLTRLHSDSILPNYFIQLWILHESCSPVCVDKFWFLNRLILITKDQDIHVWISSVKVENPATRRILTRVCRSDSRDSIARYLKFADQLQANLKDFFGPRIELKKCWNKGVNWRWN